MAQYMRPDCLEISCVKSNANFSSESILVNIGKALDLDTKDNDTSIAHPLPSYSNEALPKIIVKFYTTGRTECCLWQKKCPAWT